MEKEDLEIVIQTRVKPIVKEATSRFLGVNIDKLNEDITSRLTRTSIIDIEVDNSLKFKAAKKKFKKQYIRKLLKLNLGNISEVAKLINTNRRSLHRLINEFNIDVNKIKKDLLKPYELKKTALNYAIEKVLDNYKTIIHPKKMENIYKNVSLISEDILRELPEAPLTLKEAEKEFELKYLKKAIEIHGSNVAKTAKAIGLRYEVLHRKLKGLGLI